MTKASIVFTATGQRLITHGGKRGCWDSEEISRLDNQEVADGTICDIREEPIDAVKLLPRSRAKQK